MKFDRFYILLGSVLLATIFAGRSIADSTHASDEKKRNEPFQLSLATQNHGLQGYLSTFFDEGRMANITDMLAKPDLFSINTKSTPTYGYSTARLWLRMAIKNDLPDNTDYILKISYAPLRVVKVYCVDARQNLTREFTTGINLPFDHRPINHHYFAFPLHLDRNEEMTIFIQAETIGSLQVPISIVTKNAFIEESFREYLLFGIYYGFVIIISIYSFFVFFSLKDASFLIYCGYIVSVALAQLSLHGFAYQYLWPSAPKWNNVASLFFVEYTIVFLSFFTLKFLDTKRNLPKMTVVLVIYITLFVGLNIATIVCLNNKVVRITGVLTTMLPFVMLPVGFLSLRKGVNGSGYYVTAIVLYVVGAGLYGFKDLGILPSTILTENGIVLGSACEILFFSLGLATKIKLLQREKESVLFASNRHLAIVQVTQSIAHDLKTPINAIQSALDSRNWEEFNLKKANSHSAMMRLRSMVESFRRADLEGVVKPHWGEIPWQQIIDEMDLIAGAAGVALHCKDPYSDQIYADVSKIERVVMNLIKNAIEADAQNVWISTEVMGMDLALEIVDDGPGVPDDFVPKLFGRGNSCNKADGSGLGLNFVKETAGGHGGEAAYSRIDGKSCFRVSLPGTIKARLHEEKMDQQLQNMATSNETCPATREEPKRYTKVSLCLSNKELEIKIIAAVNEQYPLIEIDSTLENSAYMWANDHTAIKEAVARRVPIQIISAGDSADQITAAICNKLKYFA